MPKKYQRIEWQLAGSRSEFHMLAGAKIAAKGEGGKEGKEGRGVGGGRSQGHTCPYPTIHGELKVREGAQCEYQSAATGWNQGGGGRQAGRQGMCRHLLNQMLDTGPAAMG